MNFGQQALQVLRTVAPTVALAVGGPFGPLAATAISAALGTSPGDSKAAESALMAANPDQLLALKKAEMDFQSQMKQLEINEQALVFADDANAREREQVVKDFTPRILAYFVTLGFFGILGWLLYEGKPPGGDVIMVMLGALGTSWTGIISYYFGSSAGSASKDKTISDIAKS